MTSNRYDQHITDYFWALTMAAWSADRRDAKRRAEADAAAYYERQALRA